ncbi:MAG: hypothetical protein O2923_04935 [Verrucomicrobia bacterium]|nr:hypothetical protein [Verrucomicrobiota bacterium]MDA1086780.1 hypothetical protein [Verrucomicrobiota bacterium]
MSPSVAGTCPHCRELFRTEIDASHRLACPRCEHEILETLAPERVFEACVMCDCDAFYRQKDFNSAIGCCIVLFAAVLVPWTYGLSLIPAALVDWFLYRRTADMVVCYRCRSQFRGFDIPQRIVDFDHYLAEKHEAS